MLGMIQNNLGNYAEAIAAWDQVLERDPEARGLQVSPAEFLVARGKALLNLGKVHAAIGEFDRAVRLAPDADTKVWLGEACEQAGDVARAVALWKEALADAPRDVKAREGLARAALEKNAPAEALQWLEPAAGRRDLTSAAAYLFQRAHTLLGDREAAAHWEAETAKLRQREQRAGLIDRGLRDAPHSFWSRAVRAYRFAAKGNRAQAQVLVGPLLHEAPNEPFLRQLADFLDGDGELPSLDLLPMRKF